MSVFKSRQSPFVTVSAERVPTTARLPKTFFDIDDEPFEVLPGEWFIQYPGGSIGSLCDENFREIYEPAPEVNS